MKRRAVAAHNNVECAESAINADTAAETIAAPAETNRCAATCIIFSAEDDSTMYLPLSWALQQLDDFVSQISNPNANPSRQRDVVRPFQQILLEPAQIREEDAVDGQN